MGGSSLANYVERLASAAQWSIKNFRSTDEEKQIALALSAGRAVAVCDGSYKDEKGSSALVLEGASPEGRFLGTDFPPGPRSSQNSYRSKLAGIYGIITKVSTICFLYSIQSAGLLLLVTISLPSKTPWMTKNTQRSPKQILLLYMQ